MATKITYNGTTLGGGPSITVDTVLTDGSPNAIANNAVVDGLALKQALLQSGTNIKTINNTSILGSGNITITGGSGGGLTEAEVNAIIASKTSANYVTNFGVKNSDKYPGEVFGNEGVGTGYPLSVYYNTLSAAQVDFPTATALTDVVDGLAIQNAVDFALYDPASKSGVVIIPSGPLYLSRTISVGYGVPFIDAGGQTRNYVSITLLGSKASRGSGTPTEKSTTLIPQFYDAPVLSIQGNSKSIIMDITAVGRNTGIPVGGDLYTYSAQKQSNYISPYNTSTDGLGGNYNIEAHRYSPYAFAAVDPYSSHPSLWEAAPSGVTLLPYADVVINPKYFAEGQRGQWWKNVSTDVRFINCDASNFIVGAVIHPNGSDGNGDFMRFTNCTFSFNMIGIAPCQSQARLTTFDYGAMDVVWTAIHCSIFGRRQGRFMGGIGTHISGHQLAYINNMSINGPLQFDRYYAESLASLGTYGYNIANTGHPVFNSCDFNFGHGEAGWIPMNILSGYSATFNDTRLYGRTLDMACEIPPTISNCRMEIMPQGAYDNTWGFSYDVNNTYYYHRALFNHPISTGTSKKINAIGNNIMQVHITQSVFNENSFGSNAYKYIETAKPIPGATGELGDYLWSADNIFVGTAFTSFVNDKLVFDVANIGYASQLVKDLIKEGDIIEIPTIGFKFMIYNRTGTVCEAQLLNGFSSGFEYALGVYSLAQMQALLSNAAISWTWFNNNFTDATSFLQFGKQWAIKANVTAGSPNVTGIEYVTPLNNGSRQEAVENFPPSFIVQYYGYTGMASIPTTLMETNIIQSVNVGAKTAVLKNNSTITGQVLFFSKWPYDKR